MSKAKTKEAFKKLMERTNEAIKEYSNKAKTEEEIQDSFKYIEVVNDFSLNTSGFPESVIKREYSKSTLEGYLKDDLIDRILYLEHAKDQLMTSNSKYRQWREHAKTVIEDLKGNREESSINYMDLYKSSQKEIEDKTKQIIEVEGELQQTMASLHDAERGLEHHQKLLKEYEKRRDEQCENIQDLSKVLNKRQEKLLYLENLIKSAMRGE